MSIEGWVIYKKRMFCSQEAYYKSVLWIFLCQTIPTCGILLNFHFLKVTCVSHTSLTSASAGTDITGITRVCVWEQFFGAHTVYSVCVYGGGGCHPKNKTKTVKKSQNKKAAVFFSGYALWCHSPP